jgi:hypothetical protein
MPTRLAEKPATVPHHTLAGRNTGPTLAIVVITLLIICSKLIWFRDNPRRGIST